MWAQHCWTCVWIPWHFKQFKLQELCISVRGIKKEAAFCSVMMFYWISKVARPSRESLGCQENSIFSRQPSALLRQHLQNDRENILSTLRRNSVRLNPFFPWTKEGNTFCKASLNQQWDLKHLARSWLQKRPCWVLLRGGQSQPQAIATLAVQTGSAFGGCFLHLDDCTFDSD